MQTILIITPSLEGGGAERSTAQVSKYLSDNHNVIIVTYYTTGQEYDYDGKLINLNLLGDKRNIFHKFLVLLKRYYKIKEIKSEYEVDVTISNLENANLLNLLTKSKDKVILTIRSFKSKRNKGIKGKIYKFLMAKFYNKSHHIVAVSQGIKDDLIKNYKIIPDKVKVLGNGIDLKNIKQMKNSNQITQNIPVNFDIPTIITVGNLNENKGQWHLIRSFYYLSKSKKNFQLIILGEGVLRQKLEKLVIDLGLENKVHLIGSVSNPFYYINKSEIFVLTSIVEGFGNVLLESMACKTPIISTDSPSGPREILAKINNGYIKKGNYLIGDYGILTPCFEGSFMDSSVPILRNEIILASAMEELLEDEELKIKFINKFDERLNDFSLEKMKKEWECLVR